MTENRRPPNAGIEVPCVAQAGSAPEYATAEAAGADLRARLSEPMVLGPGDYAAVPTGVSMAIPPGFEGQVRPRSGLAARYGVTVLNAPGTIDADYRGEVRVVLINHGRADFTIQPGDRIAQLILARSERARFVIKQSIDATERGDGGFGSTGSS